ncbi:hypothetical protein HDV04_003915 [Boothiomyces sp. JEL0838]|nr:hypothetical protein HDV04_001356 [Boothiomyces sp. JEL0838]KAJ3311537.1 hypothetical protein HDV04_003915 [Boothiomyces sp. JEL0838]
MTKRSREIEETEPEKKIKITADEVKLYDRQIRLWGMEAQQRMRNSKILVIGITGLSNEILKNIVLAGVGQVTLLDHSVVKDVDLGVQFLLRKEDLGKHKVTSVLPKLQLLNPRVTFTTITDSIDSKNEEFYDGYDIVVLTSGNPAQITKINDICHKKGIKFWAASNMGLHSFIFADLISHDFTTETRVTSMTGETLKKEERTEAFYPISKLRKVSFGQAELEGRAARRWAKQNHPLYFAINSTLS